MFTDEGREGFEVTEETEVQDLTEVKEQRTLVPATKDVKFVIYNASTQASKDKSIKSLKLELQIVDGIEVFNPETQEKEIKFIGRKMFTGFMDLVYWADMTKAGRTDSDWWKNNQHLVGFKQLCMALGISLAGIKVNDKFVTELVGRNVLATITHEEDTAVDEKGARQKTGVFRERLKFWKKAE